MAKQTDNTASLKAARDRFTVAETYWRDDRKQALDDLRFRAGAQWPENLRKQREADKRPCLVVDKLNQYIRQVVNDGRQNRPSIGVRPVDSAADIATAEVFQGLIRYIEDTSAAGAAYDTALEGAASCGQGAFRVLSRYTSDASFEQELYIMRCRNHLAVIPDPDVQAADCSDMKYCFVVDALEKTEFEAQYPDKLPTNWESGSEWGDWYGSKVRIAEYWEVREKSVKMHQMQDGSVVPESRLQELRKAGIEVDSLILQSRTIPQREVWYSKMTGAEYLEEPRKWPGQWIPIFIVWGNELDIEGKVSHSGLIRGAKDPQRLYNYSRSAFAERVALTPKAPWVAAEGQVEDYEKEWETANTGNHSVLRYKPTSINGTVVPPPQRTSASDVPAGFAQDMQLSEHDIQASMGMYNASLGAPSNERSGKAIVARQREGDVGTFHYHDNLNRAIRHCGRVLVDLIPKFYDTARVVRIMGYDGAVSEATLDPNLEVSKQMQGAQAIYNLGVGKYDVSISTGPSYNTLRQEAAEAMGRLVENNGELMSVLGDILFKNLDWPGAQELSERMRLILPPQIQQAEVEKKQQNASPEVRAMVSQFKQAIEQKDQSLGQALDIAEQLKGQLMELQRQLEEKGKELDIKAREVEVKKFEAETKRLDVTGSQETEQLRVVAESMRPEAESAEPAEPMEPSPSITELLQALAELQKSMPQPITQLTVERGGGVRKEIVLQAPSGQIYTGAVSEVAEGE